MYQVRNHSHHLQTPGQTFCSISFQTHPLTFLLSVVLLPAMLLSGCLHKQGELSPLCTEVFTSRKAKASTQVSPMLLAPILW